MSTAIPVNDAANGKITGKTLAPLGAVAAAGIILVSLAIRFSAVSAATEINRARIESTNGRIDRIEKQLDRIEQKLDSVLKEIRR